MKKLSQWDADKIEGIRGRIERYKALNTQLEDSVKNNAIMPEADFEELQQLQNAVASDATSLLRFIDHYFQ